MTITKHTERPPGSWREVLSEGQSDVDGLIAWLTDRTHAAHSTGDTWSSGAHDAYVDTLDFVKTVAFSRFRAAIKSATQPEGTP